MERMPSVSLGVGGTQLTPPGYITQERRLKPENTTKSLVRHAKTETADVWLPQAGPVSVPVTYGT